MAKLASMKAIDNAEVYLLRMGYCLQFVYVFHHSYGGKLMVARRQSGVST